MDLYTAGVTTVYPYSFFQAEDGIRDHCVTGVQTCALPISLNIAKAEEQLQQLRMQRTQIIAPFDGVISQRKDRKSVV